jgi:hypothetical protein
LGGTRVSAIFFETPGCRASAEKMLTLFACLRIMPEHFNEEEISLQVE